MKYRVVTAFNSAEGVLSVGDEIDVGDEDRAHDLVRWGLVVPADLVVPKSVPDAGTDAPSLSSGPADPLSTPFDAIDESTTFDGSL